MLQDGLLLRHFDDALRTEFQLCKEKSKKNANIDDSNRSLKVRSFKLHELFESFLTFNVYFVSNASFAAKALFFLNDERIISTWLCNLFIKFISAK